MTVQLGQQGDRRVGGRSLALGDRIAIAVIVTVNAVSVSGREPPR
ncbi:MAG TPA: hypothetical protein VH021_25220 [Trebonia sp.]|nr:hypothetical protein [Trebonia sp.]